MGRVFETIDEFAVFVSDRDVDRFNPFCFAGGTEFISNIVIGDFIHVGDVGRIWILFNFDIIFILNMGESFNRVVIRNQDGDSFHTFAQTGGSDLSGFAGFQFHSFSAAFVAPIHILDMTDHPDFRLVAGGFF